MTLESISLGGEGMEEEHWREDGGEREGMEEEHGREDGGERDRDSESPSKEPLGALMLGGEEEEEEDEEEEEEDEEKGEDLTRSGKEPEANCGDGKRFCWFCLWWLFSFFNGIGEETAWKFSSKEEAAYGGEPRMLEEEEYENLLSLLVGLSEMSTKSTCFLPADGAGDGPLRSKRLGRGV